jgi:hypothetical protein
LIASLSERAWIQSFDIDGRALERVMDEGALFALRAMTNVNELQRLIAQIEQAAREALPAHISAEDTGLLLEALDAGMLAAAPEAGSAERRFRIVAWDHETSDRESGVESLIAYAATIEMARIVFGVAVNQNPGRKIWLYDGERVIEQSGDVAG